MSDLLFAAQQANPSRSYCICNRDQDQNDSGQLVQLEGHVYFVYIFNLKKFIKRLSFNEEVFDQYRGDNTFFEAIKNLQTNPASGFTIDMDEENRVRAGHTSSIFRGQFKREWLATTYRMAIQDQPEYANHRITDCRIRLSRLGLAEVILTRQVGGEHQLAENLIDLLTALIHVDTEIRGQPQNLWSLAVNCLNRFIWAIGSILKVRRDISHSNRQRSFFRRMTSDIQLTLRGSYDLPYYPPFITIVLEHVLCNVCNRRLTASRLLETYPQALMSILEYPLRRQENTIRLSNISYRSLERLTNNISSRDGEFCVFTPNRCLIYYEPGAILLSFGTQPIEELEHREFWKSILRGIEHSISMRASIQIFEENTTGLFESMPELARVVADFHSTDDELRALVQLSHVMANYQKKILLLRSASTPKALFAMGTEFEASLFTYLYNSVLNFPESLDSIQRDVDVLTHFMLSSAGAAEQRLANSDSFSLSAIAISLSIIAMLLTAPSFIKDLDDYLSTLFRRQQCPAWLLCNLNDYMLVIPPFSYFLLFAVGFSLVVNLIFRRNKKNSEPPTLRRSKRLLRLRLRLICLFFGKLQRAFIRFFFGHIQ